ncbi:MAG: GNAT family N-acetyltransferase [Asgard group archaeon]|nr:GNAT family N-acetyltransferase [Asgard group archaeon]
MSELRIIIGEKEEISEQYLAQLFALRQQHEEEIFPFIPPSLEFYKESWKIPDISSRKSLWSLAINEDNLVIGYGIASWNIKFDNLDKAYFSIYVSRLFRRKGYGSLLLKNILEKLPSQIEKLNSGSSENCDGLPFLRNLKTEESYVEMISIADLADFNLNQIINQAQEQKEKALAKGYEIIFVDNANYADYLDYPEFVKVVESIWNDMPRENLSDEDSKVTVELHQEIYDYYKLRGAKYFTYVAMHKQTKKIVGFTTAAVYKYQPWVTWQDDTGIIHEHRGHGLGLAIKYQMLKKLLQETKVKYWFTGNNHKNEHMIKINRILKHKKRDSEIIFEFDRKLVSNHLAKKTS